MAGIRPPAVVQILLWPFGKRHYGPPGAGYLKERWGSMTEEEKKGCGARCGKSVDGAVGILTTKTH